MYSVVYISIENNTDFRKTLYRSKSLAACQEFLVSCKNVENIFIVDRMGDVVMSADDCVVRY